MSHTIETTFISKDPEYSLTYTEDDTGVKRSVTVPIFVDDIEVGSLNQWDSKDPMSEADRERVLDRLAAWAFQKGDSETRIMSGGVAVRLPKPAVVEVCNDDAPGARYCEPGRAVFVCGHEIRPAEGKRRVRVYMDTATTWIPGGEAVTATERDRIRAALEAFKDEDNAIVVASSLQTMDPWQIAVDMEEWNDSIAAILPNASVMDQVTAGKRQPGGWFWCLEFHALYVSGRTGRNCKPNGFVIGPVAGDKWKILRTVLRGEGLSDDTGSNPEKVTREKLFLWSQRRAKGESPPADLAKRVLGVVLRRADIKGEPDLAVYADGSVRLITSRSLVVYEAGPCPAVEKVGAELLALAQTVADGGSDSASDDGLVLTCAGPRQIACGQPVMKLCDDLLRLLVNELAPLKKRAR